MLPSDRSYDMRRVKLDVVRALCARHHGYGTAGASSVYAFAVFEQPSLGMPERVVAAYAWQPPPPGAARAVAPGVLSLSRMVAVPRGERLLNHVSKPLRAQMRSEIDRTRWPVLVTYSDEGQGHTGHVYQCSGWVKTERHLAPVYETEEGGRVSRYANGRTGARDLRYVGETAIQRWEHRICPAGEEAAWMASHGWRRVPVVGKVWRSGNPAFTYAREAS